MCGLTSGDAHSSTGEALHQCIFEEFDVMLKNRNLRLYREVLERTEPNVSKNISRADSANTYR